MTTTEETIRAAIEAYARRDLEGALSHCAETVRFCNIAAPGTGMWTFDCQGLTAFREALVEINTAFEIEDYRLVELIAAGPRAASRQQLTLVSRATGERFDTEIADFWTVEHGKITTIHEFNDTAKLAPHHTPSPNRSPNA